MNTKDYLYACACVGVWMRMWMRECACACTCVCVCVGVLTPNHLHFAHGETMGRDVNGYINISSANGIRWARDTSPLTGWRVPTVLATSCEGAGQLVIAHRKSSISNSNKEILHVIEMAVPCDVKMENITYLISHQIENAQKTRPSEIQFTSVLRSEYKWKNSVSSIWYKHVMSQKWNVYNALLMQYQYCTWFPNRKYIPK